ncbi:MAG: carbamoyltransferase HypF, partial [Bacteroidales bacterium]|nr:carbamoyltransferase HypF [Bacteroidales bacterium]
YPLINCTNCGPRFSIIEDLPYDRPNTSMKSFRMCGNCERDYNNILDRRFHAQPVACNRCGPVYIYKDPFKQLPEIKDILEEVALQIHSGKIVAVKGTGGYHLMCDALNDVAVADLRIRKQRDAKPFAVMFRDLESVEHYCFVDDEEKKELTSWRRPVVILRKKTELAGSVSRGLNTTGAILPYMPLHYLLFRKLQTPAVVLTSGNISDEPVIIDDTQAGKIFKPIADSFLSYDREIINRTDDSVIRIINSKPCLFRRSRGYVPQPVDLKFNVEGILALGAEQKSNFCLGKGRQAVMSQHIGDLKNKPTYDFMLEAIKRFSKLFRFKPTCIACDLHPDYLSTKYAAELEDEFKIPVVRIQHHHAHIVSCMAEYGLDEKVIGVSLDGTGYGTDGNIWGSEFLIADLKTYQRFIHFDYVPLPGGDKAVEEPWRAAFSYILKYFGKEFDPLAAGLFSLVDKQKLSLVGEMLGKNINSPLSSGAGRLFDAVSALLGLCSEASFDSEPPVRLESVIEYGIREYYPFHIGKTVVFAETFRAIMEDIPTQPVSVISAKFHNTIAHIILEVSEQIRSISSLKKIVLSGGVFQNKYLTEKTVNLLSGNRFTVYTNNLVPPNDGGLSLGQLVIASKILK